MSSDTQLSGLMILNPDINVARRFIGGIFKLCRGYDFLDPPYLYTRTVIRSRSKFSFKALAAAVFEFLRPIGYCRLAKGKVFSEEVLFVATSANQTDALRPLSDELQYRGVSVRWLIFFGKRSDFCLSPLCLIIFYVSFLLLAICKFRIFFESIRRAGFRRTFWSYYFFFAPGIKFNQFNGLVFFSNDHSYLPRSIRIASTQRGIRTGYLQHAAVSEIFPPLEFSMAFLDGPCASQIYADIAKRNATVVKGRVHLFGNARLDRIFALRGLRENRRVKFIGVAINKLDSLAQVSEKVKMLRYLGASVVVRPHPRLVLSSEFLSSMQELDCLVKEPSDQNLVGFLLSIDALVAGDSSIHIEAIASGIPSFQADFGGGGNDYYGFLANGLVARLQDFQLCLLYDSKARSSLLCAQSNALGYYMANRPDEYRVVDSIADVVEEELAMIKQLPLGLGEEMET